MDGCNINNILSSSLETKVNSIINTIITLESQGYIVNECKLMKLNNAIMLSHAVENDFILTHNQKHNLNYIVNKFLAI